MNKYIFKFNSTKTIKSIEISYIILISKITDDQTNYEKMGYPINFKIIDNKL